MCAYRKSVKSFLNSFLEAIQNKINQLIEFARTSGVPSDKSIAPKLNENDLLVKSIRTQRDADIFLAQLDAAVYLANRK